MKIINYFLTLILIFLSNNTYSYSTDIYVGKIIKQTGSSFIYNSNNSKYLPTSRQLKIQKNIILKTRSNSQVHIKFNRGETLTLFPKSKVHLNYSKKQKKIIITVIKGKARLKEINTGSKLILIKPINHRYGYSGENISIKKINKNFKLYTSNASKVLKYDLGKKSRLSFTKNDLNKIISPTHKKVKNIKLEPVSSSNNLVEQEANTSSQGSIANELNDLFGEDTKEPQAASETSSKTSKVFFNDDKDKFKIDYNLLLRSVGYVKKTPSHYDIDSFPVHLDTRLNASNKFVLSTNGSVSSQVYAQLSNRKKAFEKLGDTFSSKKDKKSYLTINEFHYLHNFSSSDLTVGKKVYTTGKGTIYSPSNKITPKDVIIPTDSLNLGSYLINYDYYINNTTLSAVFIPIFKAGLSSSPYSRWTLVPEGATYQFETDHPPAFSRESLQSFLKLETTYDGWDFALSFFNGPNPDPVIRNDITNISGTPNFILYREHVPVTNLSFGVSTTFAGTEFHGEILKQNAEEGKDDSYTTYVLGFNYSLAKLANFLSFNGINIIYEFTRERLHKGQTYPYYVQSSSFARLFQNGHLGRITFELNDKSSFSFDFHQDLSKHGELYILSYHYLFLDLTKLTFKYENYSGRSTSPYGIWKDNDNFSVAYNMSF